MRFRDGISPLRGWTIIVSGLVTIFLIAHFAPEAFPVLLVGGVIGYFIHTDTTPRKPIWKMFRKDQA